MNRNNLLLRGCVLRNTTRIAGLVVYAGTYMAMLTAHIQMNSTEVLNPRRVYNTHVGKSLKARY